LLCFALLCFALHCIALVCFAFHCLQSLLRHGSGLLLNILFVVDRALEANPCQPSSAPKPAPLQRKTAQSTAEQEVCIQRGIEPPTIISESGRALASAHTVLVFDVMSKRAPGRGGGLWVWAWLLLGFSRPRAA
jgi:hypothetical protein